MDSRADTDLQIRLQHRIHAHVQIGFLQNMTSSTRSMNQKMNPARETKRRKLLVMFGSVNASRCEESIRIFPGAPGCVFPVKALFGSEEGRILDRNMSATPPDRAPAVKLDAEAREFDPMSRCGGLRALLAARTDEGGGKEARRERRRVSWACESWTSTLGLPAGVSSPSSVAEGGGMRIALGGIWANARRNSCSTEGMAAVWMTEQNRRQGETATK